MSAAYTKWHGDRAQQLEALRAKGWRVVTLKTAPVVVAFKQDEKGRVDAKGWKGKADKPSFYYNFRDMKRAEDHVAEFARNIAAWEGRKKERQAAKKAVSAADHWMVGDVIYNSWGYDQTNIDFYQVVEVKAKSVVLRAIKQRSSDQMGGPHGGYCQPCRNEFLSKSEPILKRVDEQGSVHFEYGGASKWTGKALYTSSYH